MLPTRFWAEMTWRDFQSPGIEEAIAVLPVAAVEQHGPHLPLGVDLLLMQGYIERVVARLPDELPVLFLPIQAIGGLEVVSNRTETASGRPLLMVTEKLPLSLDRITRRGADTVTEPSSPCTQVVAARVAASERTLSSRAK